MNLTQEQEDYIPEESLEEKREKTEHIVFSKEPHMMIVHATDITPDQLVNIGMLLGVVEDD